MPDRFNKVLIVDDDMALKPLWKAILSRHSPHTQFEWAVSSEEAHRLIGEPHSNRGPFDLIIADVFLAGSETGIELLQSPQVQALCAKSVLVSSAERAPLESHCRQVLPMARVLSKPLNVVKCERLLEDLCG